MIKKHRINSKPQNETQVAMAGEVGLAEALDALGETKPEPPDRKNLLR